MARGRRKPGRQHASPDDCTEASTEVRSEENNPPVDSAERQADFASLASLATSGLERPDSENNDNSSFHDCAPDSDVLGSERADPCTDVCAAGPSKSNERKQGPTRGKRRGGHASPDKECETLVVGSNRAACDDSNETDSHPGTERPNENPIPSRSLKGKGHKKRANGAACDDSNETDSHPGTERPNENPIPSRSLKGKERKQGRQSRASGHHNSDDDHESSTAGAVTTGAAQQVMALSNPANKADIVHFPVGFKGSRRRRRAGRRNRDDASDSDAEPAGHPSDDRKAGKRAPESSSNNAKHNVEKLGREAAGTCFVSFKTFHGKHLAALPNGELRGKGTVIGDPEKFELTRHAENTISLKTCHGTYVAVDGSGDVRAHRTAVGDQEKFELIQHAPGAVDKHTFIGTGYMCVSLKTCYGLYIAADPKGGVKANRQAVSGWESFHLKVRVQAARSKKNQDQATEQDIDGASADFEIPLFDACCDLEGVLTAEENYAKSHNDHVALAFVRRVRTRRAQGLEYSFSHFREEQIYPSCFSGCVAIWDATNIFPLEESPREGSDFECSEFDHQRRHAWAAILAETSGTVSGPRVKAAFGIPAASAAEVDLASMVRLRQLARHPQCVAIGPIGIDLSSAPPAATVKEEHRGLNAADIMAVFGTPPSKFHESPKAVYVAKRDPMCIRMLAAGVTQASWIEKHGDRRLSEYEGACHDYAMRRLDAQFKVAEEQMKLAVELHRTLIIQLPPQDEAERRMVEILVAVLGEGSPHPVLLSAFRGRPKCTTLLLKHMPGLMIGFSGLLTHAKLRDCLGEVAFDVPLDRIVLESLGPRYPPAVPGIGDARGSFSHPAHVRIVAEELAKVKGIEVSAVLQAAWTNSCRLFNIAADVEVFHDAIEPEPPIQEVVPDNSERFSVKHICCIQPVDNVSLIQMVPEEQVEEIEKFHGVKFPVFDCVEGEDENGTSVMRFTMTAIQDDDLKHVSSKGGSICVAKGAKCTVAGLQPDNVLCRGFLEGLDGDGPTAQLRVRPAEE